MVDLSALTVSAPASYPVAVALTALDALIPVLPSEPALIALGVATAGRTDPRIAVLIALATALVMSAVVEALRRAGLRQQLGKASRRPDGSWAAESAAGTQSGSAPAPSTRTGLTTGRRGEDL
jgi:hypothetical protein